MAVVAPAAHMDKSGRLCSLSSYNNFTWSYVYGNYLITDPKRLTLFLAVSSLFLCSFLNVFFVLVIL